MGKVRGAAAGWPPGGSREDYARIRSRGGSLESAERRAAFERLAAGHHTVKLHLTARCNLHCRSCYSDSETPRALSREEIMGVISQLRGKPCRLDLLGGEPVLHPDLVEIVSWAHREVGIPVVFLYTNGTRIDDETAARLAEGGLHTAIVSLHGDLASVHERVTTVAGSFEQTLRGIDALVRAGVRTYTFTVASALNASRLEQMRALAAERRVGALFFPYVPQRPNDELSIADPSALREMLRFVIRTSYVYRPELLRSLADGCTLCRAFTRTITVLADGLVTPCPFLALPLGNVRDAPLFEILAGSYRHARLAELLADPEECGPCSIRNVCGGGCRAGRYTTCGELNRRDACCLDGPFVQRVSISALPDHLPYVY